MESTKKSVEVPRAVLAALLGLNTISLVGTAAMGWVLHRELREGRAADQVQLAGDSLTAHQPESDNASNSALSHRNPANAPVTPGEFVTEPFTVTLADSHASHYAKVHVTIEPDQPLSGPELERLRPRMRDFVTVLLSSKRLEQIDNEDGKEELRYQIQRGLEKYVERDRLKHVYFSEFLLQ